MGFDKKIGGVTIHFFGEDSAEPPELYLEEHPRTSIEKGGALRLLKAIGTKPSEEREKPVKQAPKNPTAKVGASANGNKTYSYGNKVNPPGEKAAPTQSTPSGESPEKPMSASPERLATLLGISTSTLQKLATGKTEQQFVHHFRAKGSTFMAKYRVPDDYLHEVYAALHKMNPVAKGGMVRVAREHLREDITEAEENIKQLKHGIKRDKAALKEKKSANPAVPPRELKARGVTLAKDVPGLLARSFAVNPGKLKKGSEEQRFAEVMVVSGVTSVPKLATLLHKGYDLSKSQADEMAVELFSTLKSEGALT